MSLPDIEGRDVTMPEGSWEFDAEVTEVFDDMLARSIPQYDVMRSTVTDLIDYYAPKSGYVFEPGFSRGGAIAALADRRPDLRITGGEISKPMLDAAHVRFQEQMMVAVQYHDLTADAMPARCDVVLLNLTLQFTPIEERQKILAKIRASTPTLILVEKVLGGNAELEELLTHQYYEEKRRNGYTLEQIKQKRHSLQGVLVPVTAKWNEDLLAQAGFTSVDCFWRWMNFAGWVAR